MHGRQAFSIEIDLLQGYYGRKFRGVFKRNIREGIFPVLYLERASIEKIRQVRSNQERANQELFEKMNLNVLIPARPILFFELILYIPVWLDFLVAWYAKKKMMNQYKQICLRHRMIYFSFVAEQNGTLVPAVDMRPLDEDEWRMLGGAEARQHPNPLDAGGDDPSPPA